MRVQGLPAGEPREQERRLGMIDRRSFGKVFGAGAAAASLAGLSGLASQPASAATPHGPRPGTGGPASARGTYTSLGALKQVDAGVLNIGYAESGPADGPVVMLLHGWPYDIHSYVDVAPLLAAEGYRVIVPHLRGHGTTRFLSPRAFRNAQQSVV